jgi:hypothetical protein
VKYLPHGSPVSLWRRSAVARPAARAVSTVRSKSTPAASPASSAAVIAGGFGRFVGGVLGAIGLLALSVLPVALWIKTGDPTSAVYGLLVCAMLAVCWFVESREQAAELRNLPKPRRPTFPVTEDYQAKWSGSAGRARRAPVRETEPVELWIVDQPAYGPDPDILGAHKQTLVEAMEQGWLDGKAAGRSHDEIQAEMVSILACVPRRSAGSYAKQQVVGAGSSPRGGRGRLWGGAVGAVIEARAERGRLARREW